MKKVMIWLPTLTFLFGCSPETKVTVYSIGKEYTFGEWNVKATIETENEKFVFDYQIKDENKTEAKYSSIFYFILVLGDGTRVNNHTDVENQIQFRLENGDDVTFDSETGHYSFYIATTIIADYSNAKNNVKKAIFDKDYTLEFGCGLYRADIA